MARTVDSLQCSNTEAIGSAADMPPTEAIAGRSTEAHRYFNIAVGLTVGTRIAVAIVAIEEAAVGIFRDRSDAGWS